MKKGLIRGKCYFEWILIGLDLLFTYLRVKRCQSGMEPKRNFEDWGGPTFMGVWDRFWLCRSDLQNEKNESILALFGRFGSTISGFTGKMVPILKGFWEGLRKVRKVLKTQNRSQSPIKTGFGFIFEFCKGTPLERVPKQSEIDRFWEAFRRSWDDIYVLRGKMVPILEGTYE